MSFMKYMESVLKEIELPTTEPEVKPVVVSAPIQTELPEIKPVINKFDNWKDVTGQVVSSSIKTDLKMKDGAIIPAGTKIEFVFVKKNSSYGIKVIKMDSTVRSVPFLVGPSNQSISAIKPRPSMKTLEKYVSDSICATVTGKRTEPAGEGPDGSPSWLLVLGLI